MKNFLEIEEVTVVLISCKADRLCQTVGNAELQMEVWRTEKCGIARVLVC